MTVFFGPQLVLCWENAQSTHIYTLSDFNLYVESFAHGLRSNITTEQVKKHDLLSGRHHRSALEFKFSRVSTFCTYYGSVLPFFCESRQKLKSICIDLRKELDFAFSHFSQNDDANDKV